MFLIPVLVVTHLKLVIAFTMLSKEEDGETPKEGEEGKPAPPKPPPAPVQPEPPPVPVSSKAGAILSSLTSRRRLRGRRGSTLTKQSSSLSLNTESSALSQEGSLLSKEGSTTIKEEPEPEAPKVKKPSFVTKGLYEGRYHPEMLHCFKINVHSSYWIQNIILNYHEQ